MDEFMLHGQSDIQGTAGGKLPPSDSARGALDSLVEAQQLFALCKLPEAIRFVRSATNISTAPSQAHVLLVRCLAIQGRYQEAGLVCKTALDTASYESDVIWMIRLWHAFLQAYIIGDPVPAITQGYAALEWARRQSDAVRLTAQVQALLAKALALAVTYALEPMGRMAEARALLTRAIESHRHIGETDEVLNTLLRLGQFYLIGDDADQAKAQAVFQEVLDQARSAGNQVCVAEALLRLAELDFDATQSRLLGTPNSSVDLPLYQEAFNHYEQVGHSLGPADVLLSLGRRLIGVGLDGTNFLQQALHLYRQEENLIGVYSIMGALGTWYVQQGDLAQSLNYHQQMTAVAQEMGFPLGQATAFMGIGDYFFRLGHYAKALSYYEQAEALAKHLVVGAMVGLQLANAYVLMHLPDRAENACRRAIEALRSGGPGSGLSLALFILGNILTSKGDWSAAITVWREGIIEDEARHDVLSQVEKLQCIAQATVMQYYHPEGPPVPDAAYEEAMDFYAQAITLLEAWGDPRAHAAVANTYELRGQTAATCGRPLDAARYLEQARNGYAALGMAMQTAVTNTIVGLLYNDLGKRDFPDLYVEADGCYQQALDYFQQARMLDMVWKVLLYQSLTAFHRGRLALTGDEQQLQWRRADTLLEEAGTAIEFVRGRFLEPDQLATQMARMGLVADKEKVYVTAVQLHYYYLKDPKTAFTWLERLKGRAFLDALALTPLHPPLSVDRTLLEQESNLLLQLSHASTQTEVVALNEQLHTIWDQMSTHAAPAVTEYVMLRRGDPVGWKEVVSMLQVREDN